MASMVYRVVVGRFVGLVVVLKDRFFIGDYVLLQKEVDRIVLDYVFVNLFV